MGADCWYLHCFQKDDKSSHFPNNASEGRNFIEQSKASIYLDSLSNQEKTIQGSYELICHEGQKHSYSQQ